MSASEGPEASWLGILSGTGVTAIAGGLVGFAYYSMGALEPPKGSEEGFYQFVWLLSSGLILGIVPLMSIGFCAAWHGASVGADPEPLSMAPVWGVATGAVLGLSLGPFLGWGCGMVLGFPITGGVMGFYGVLAGILGWEAGFFGSRLSAG